MDSSSSVRHLSTFYKGGDVFNRDEEYYNQILNSTRRNNPNFNNSNLARQTNANYPNNPQQVDSVIYNQQNNSRAFSTQQVVDTQYNRGNVSSQPGYIQGSQVSVNQPGVVVNQPNYLQGQQLLNSPALQENVRLKAQVDQLVNGDTSFGNSENVVKLSYYSLSQGEIKQIKDQESEIARLQEVIARNNNKIDTYRKAAQQLQTRMNNIQSIDKEIYKNLQGASNRDRDLLDKASSALARGQKRQEVARILEQIITN